MSENDTVRVRRLPDGTRVRIQVDGSPAPLESRTDWARIAAMTEEEIDKNAANDPANPPLTADELARMRPVPDP
ncbi:MAG: hypothetical protein M3R06_06220 [Chloroflexota bacterium]|nr:hypothetical protein [Chloroflexota bacterium]